MKNLISKITKITGLLLLILGVISMTYSDIFTKKEIVEPTELITDFSNLTLCAPIQRFMVDFKNSLVPVAPKLDVKWQTKMKITTDVSAAADFFNQGLFYLYAFNHAEADRSFKEAIRLDPDCAMCHWGVGLGLGPNINMPMQESVMAEAFEFTQTALKLSENVSKKEQALIKALATRYVENPPENRKALDAIYSDEMRLVSHRFREDTDIATLFVSSLMNRMPWQYWQEDNSPKPATREVLAVLDYIAEKEPNHPGANHYYIHATEAVHPDLATPSADKLTKMELPAGHLVHMPSHIYIRTGRYHDAAIANQNAMKVDEDYIERCNIQGIYPAAYYPHNIHFLWFAASMEGRSEVSLDAARKLVSKTPKAMLKNVARLERYFTIPYFSLIRFGKWDELLAEPRPDKDMIYANVMWHYARGMAFANKGKMRKAKKELKKVSEGVENETIQELDYERFPTINLTKMAMHVLKGTIAGQKKKYDEQVAEIQKAVDLQDGLNYSEPPYFYYPVRQSLGAALLAANQPAKAEMVYREDLAKFPDSGWSLFGLHQSLIQQGKTKEAKAVYQAYEEAWVHADVKLEQSVM